MASGPITSWKIDGETMETVTNFVFLGSKITADGDGSHEIKRHLLLGRKAMTNLERVLKSRDIILQTKVCIVRFVFFFFPSSHVWTGKLDHKEGWVPKNWCFEENSSESLRQQGDQTNQSQRKSTLNIHWKGWCCSSNTLATGCKELTHWKSPWCWERLKAGREGDGRGQDGWMASRTQWTWIWANLGDGEGQGSLECCSPWGRKELDMTEWLNNRITSSIKKAMINRNASG